ncbi:MAG TPA: hypothetical protein VKH43_10305 [Thermoanaerobaculia bacterium]|nr:hypothetical protein [Thermoanaerobaculia bacterium]
MRRWAAAFLVLAACAAGGCGGKKHAREGHGQAAPATVAAAPTPDTTPIEALRTPAGLVLKTNATPVPVTPSPSPQPSPAR